LGVAFSGGLPPYGFRSSIHTAARRAGIRISVAANGPLVRVWRADAPKPGERLPEKPDLHCKVCGKKILPKPGATRQLVHAGKGNKSECQKIWRSSQAHPELTIEEAKARYYRRHRRAHERRL